MPVPPLVPFYYSCTQCDWHGPTQHSDCLLGPTDYCPDCQARLVRTHAPQVPDNLSLLDQFLKLFARN